MLRGVSLLWDEENADRTGEKTTEYLPPASERPTLNIRFGARWRGPRAQLGALVGLETPAELAPLLEPEARPEHHGSSKPVVSAPADVVLGASESADVAAAADATPVRGRNGWLLAWAYLFLLAAAFTFWLAV